MSSKKTLSVQLETSEFNRLKSLARAERRSVSSYIRNVLTVSNILPGCNDTQPGKHVRNLKKAA